MAGVDQVHPGAFGIGVVLRPLAPGDLHGIAGKIHLQPQFPEDIRQLQGIVQVELSLGAALADSAGIPAAVAGVHDHVVPVLRQLLRRRHRKYEQVFILFELPVPPSLRPGQGVAFGQIEIAGVQRFAVPEEAVASRLQLPQQQALIGPGAAAGSDFVRHLAVAALQREPAGGCGCDEG